MKFATIRHPQRQWRAHKLQPQGTLRNVNNILTAVVFVIGVSIVIYLSVTGKSSPTEIIFRGMQFVLMMLLLQAPSVLRLRYRIEVPPVLSVVVLVFAFTALVLGDGLDFYGRFTWWDKLLHAESGILLSMVAMWLIHVIMAENDKYIYFNKYFLCLFLVMFSLGMGAFWEILEYTYDSIAGTNSQQFMASTTSSIILPEDIALQGHEALRDTMTDLILDLAGAALVAAYGLLNHDKIVARYYQLVEQRKQQIQTV
ncbi:MAG: hypothetical protein IJ621_04770 [Paludibacteraceae bacterium]|nr:hypothetical protein [Paludibacteraceae bacterium]